MVNVIGKNWMGNQFDNSSFKFENGSVWKVRGKICEKALLYLYREIEIPGQPAEAQGVYHCQQTEGDDVGKEAIMKIRMQLPPDPRIASPDPKERAKFAQRNPGINSVQEVTSLERLTAANCPFAPKLFAWQVCFQSSEQWVPGGYIMVIVMEKVPGISLERFWARPFPEREKIRLSFRRSLTMLYDLRIDHYDPQPENLIYDANEDRCYIIDYEFVKFLQPDEPGIWTEEEWRIWGLAGRDYIAKRIVTGNKSAVIFLRWE